VGAPPKPKPKVEFPEPDQHVDLAELRKEIRTIILDLRSLMRKGEDQTILVEFTSVIQPGSFADPGRLPRDSDNGRSRSKRKEECLFAKVSKVIQDFWAVVLDKDCPDNAEYIAAIRAQLEALKTIQKRSLVLCKVDGNDREGYVLA